ncbi:hypothetical protein EON67_02725 [archaeon]|nr:MAG: hypothetical protein EON67_02725 [archaeon]
MCARCRVSLQFHTEGGVRHDRGADCWYVLLVHTRNVNVPTQLPVWHVHAVFVGVGLVCACRLRAGWLQWHCVCGTRRCACGPPLPLRSHAHAWCWHRFTLLQYGQTGAGKSHTMEGYPDPPELRGIIPNSFKHIFDSITSNTNPTKKSLVRTSYLEIYNEVCAGAQRRGLRVCVRVLKCTVPALGVCWLTRVCVRAHARARAGRP